MLAKPLNIASFLEIMGKNNVDSIRLCATKFVVIAMIFVQIPVAKNESSSVEPKKRSENKEGLHVFRSNIKKIPIDMLLTQVPTCCRATS